jgi:hypothetical protein
MPDNITVTLPLQAFQTPYSLISTFNDLFLDVEKVRTFYKGKILWEDRKIELLKIA